MVQERAEEPVLKKKEMTGEVVEQVLNVLPDSLTPQQLAAFLLTMTDRFAGDRPSNGMSILLTCAITYARSIGVPEQKIAEMLKATAEQVLDTTSNKRMH